MAYVKRRGESSRDAFWGRLNELGFSSYQDYLRSAHWQDVRCRYRASKLPKKCYICGDPRYQLHHRSYKTLGNENLTHLLPLCDRHHRECHARLRVGETTNVRLWTVARVLRRDFRRKREM